MNCADLYDLFRLKDKRDCIIASHQRITLSAEERRRDVTVLINSMRLNVI